MSTLKIVVSDADQETERHALEALRAAGIEVHRSWIEPDSAEVFEESGVPDRDHLKGQRVHVKLNPWTPGGPTEGVFLGQGERGFGLLVEGGGRYTYRHHEVAEVIPA